ncbi:MAG: 16S rRNA processing protein RimM [Polyangiaceae bacterium]|nr:16S rRNA processing protein RimM [Polyangiaceae bacterium]
MSTSTSSTDRLVELAVVARPHGVRGELKLKLHNEDSEALLSTREITLRRAGAPDVTARIETARRANDALLVRLCGVDTREAAEALRGVAVCVPRSSLPEPDEDEFYAIDVIGAEVVAPEGRVGEVIEFVEYPTCSVLVVATEKGKVEVPLVDGVVARVDVAARRVELTTTAALEPG